MNIFFATNAEMKLFTAIAKHEKALPKQQNPDGYIARPASGKHPLFCLINYKQQPVTFYFTFEKIAWHES